MGLPATLRFWKRLIRPGGYMGVSDCFWFTHAPTEEYRESLSKIHPGMVHEEVGVEMIKAAGYSVLGAMRLPDKAWWYRYYIPLSQRLEMLKNRYPDDRKNRLSSHRSKRSAESSAVIPANMDMLSS